MKIALFDCDSTLTSLEAIDAFAALSGVAEEVTRLTAQAMNGEVPYEAVFDQRLFLAQPTLSHQVVVGQQYVDHLVEGAHSAVTLLQNLGYHVGILSGGYIGPIAQLALALGIDLKWIYGVDLRFDEAGNYGGYDDPHALGTAAGKIGVIQCIRAEYHPSRLVMTGDGLTDLVCAPLLDVFVGYGGVAVRPRVLEGATCYSADPDLMRVLRYFLTNDELEALATTDPAAYLRIMGKSK